MPRTPEHIEEHGLEGMQAHEALEAMGPLREHTDFEQAHGDADEILCRRLWALGEHELVKLYCGVPKWYA